MNKKKRHLRADWHLLEIIIWNLEKLIIVAKKKPFFILNEI